jgi:hypothetical protein
MTVHIMEKDGAAKCGANVYYTRAWNQEKGQYEGPEIRKISMRKSLVFSSEKFPATCKRCLNKIERPQVIQAPEIPENFVFHRSFGYDMTINVFAKPIKKTPKGYLCAELTHKTVSGNSMQPGGVEVVAGAEIVQDKKPFLMTFRQKNNYTFWTGAGEHWDLVSISKTHYENHLD